MTGDGMEVTSKCIDMKTKAYDLRVERRYIPKLTRGIVL